MIDLTETQKAALALIGTRPRGDEITGKDIANTIGLRQRESGKEGADMRAVINALRKKGYPICANGKGYFYPQDRAEIEEYEESLRGRIDKATEALVGIQEAKRGWDARPEVRELPMQQQLIEI